MDTMNTSVTQETAPAASTTKDERTWAMLCHPSTLAGFVIPFGNIAGPLVIWMIKKDEFPFVDDQGKEALNFQISMTIYVIASIILIFLLVGIPLLIALGLFDLIVTVIAAINANDGVKYRYPLCIRFVS
jgi:hypothetical protein